MLNKLVKLKVAAIAALLVGITSAAMARPMSHDEDQAYQCYTDEGQGRRLPCDVG
jgi:hypothetical protein